MRAFDDHCEEAPVYGPPEPLTVEWVEDEPLGTLLGPKGELLAVVMPERPPFGFQVRNPHR